MKLLKQLIQISEVIQTFYQRVDKNTKSDVSPDSGVDVTVTDLPQIRKTPLVRQQSVPYYCRINQTGSLLSSATSSFDGMSVCKSYGTSKLELLEVYSLAVWSLEQSVYKQTHNILRFSVYKKYCFVSFKVFFENAYRQKQLNGIEIWPIYNWDEFLNSSYWTRNFV